MGYNSVADNTDVVGSQICEMPRNSEKILTYDWPRSSRVIDLDVNRKRMRDFSSH